MSLNFTLPKVSNSAGASIPVGTYVVHLKDMILEKDVVSQFGTADQVKWVFGIDQVIDSDDEDAESRVGDELWAFSNVSMGRKAKMRGYVEALMGRALEEGDEVAADALINKRAKANVVPHTRQDGTETTKVGTLLPYKAKKTAKAPVDDDEDEF